MKVKVKHLVDGLWFWRDDSGADQGPFTYEQARDAWRRGELRAHHWVWLSACEEWMRAGELRDALDRTSSASKRVYVCCALLGGMFGLHDFYAGRYLYAACYLCSFVLSFGLLTLITWPLAMLEAIVASRDGRGYPMAR